MTKFSSPTIALFGISNCDTVRKARQWLTAQGVDYHFHDFKKHPPSLEQITTWQQSVAWDKLLNRQGQTWRKLGAEGQATITDAASAAQWLTEQPSAIKRPVVQWPDGSVTIGFAADTWQALLEQQAQG